MPEQLNASRPQRTKLVWEIYDRVTELQYRDSEAAKDMLAQYEGKLHEYTGPIDTWFNLGITCARLRLRNLEWECYTEGLQEWPESVDLLCAVFQEYYGARQNPEKAAEIWARLEAIPLEKKSAYWRYWVYGAIYHSIELGDRRTALRLLDHGLLNVRRDALMDVLRSYERVLLDAPPAPVILEEYSQSAVEKKHRELIREHAENVKIVIDRYKLGLQLGVENGYELARLLAILYQEMAYFEDQPGKNAARADQGATGDHAARDAEDIHKGDYLRQALDMLDYAEKMFTDNNNHPLSQIYTTKINVLMGRADYNEAFELLQSLKASGTVESRTQFLQLQRAARGAGKPATEETLNDQAVAEYIIRDNGRSLAIMAEQLEPLKRIIKAIHDYHHPTEPAPAEQAAPEADQDRPNPISEALNLFLNRPDVLLQIAQEHEEVAQMIRTTAARLEA